MVAAEGTSCRPTLSGYTGAMCKTEGSIMTDLSRRQSLQEDMYDYPYHYIPTWDGNDFSQTQVLDWGYEYLSYLYFVLDKVNELGFASLMDVGCGDGRFLFEVNKRVCGKRLVGMDYSKRAIAYAKIMEPDIEWVHGDIKENDIFDTRFDIITLIEVLEHIMPDDTVSFLKGISNYLDNDGRFVLTVPSKNIPTSEKHYRHFDLESLSGTLSPCFEIVDVVYLNRISFTKKLMHRLLSNRLTIMNNQSILNWCYNFYTKHCLFAGANNCRRIAVICKKRT
jgi:SAM-dependent methyltransferase